MDLLESATCPRNFAEALTADDAKALSTARRILTPDLVVHLRAAPDSTMNRMVFPCLWLFISFVSAVDTYLAVRFHEGLEVLEQNPLGRWLLELHDSEPSLLIGVKFFGSTVVLGILTALYLRDRRIGLIVACGLATFQLGLLGYLVLA